MTDNNRRDVFVSKYINSNKHTLEAEMSFFDHAEELRWHIIRSVIAVFVCSVLFFTNEDFLFNSIIFGPKNPSFWTYQQMCFVADKFNIPELCISDINFTILNTELSGQFMLHITASLLSGLILAFPYFIWEVFRFIKPALSETEIKKVNVFILFVSLLFFVGVLFGYFIVVPLTINFLSSYSISYEIINQISIDSYISTLATLSLGCGITFELPILVYFLARLGIVSDTFLRENRRYAVVIILIISAFITPSSDVITQLIVSLPLFVLFEISIFVAKLNYYNTKTQNT